jgi:cation diffusion facilitator family transporter
MSPRPRPPSEPSQEACDLCALQFSWLTLAVSGGLGLLKLAVGIMAGSKALIASTLYSVNDILSGIVVIISMRVARRAPDDSHPYGYGKAEFVAVGIVSLILAGAVVYIISHSVAVLLGGMSAPPHLIVLPVTAVAMATNEFLARRGFCAAKRTESPVMHTAAEHNRADAISSLAVMIGLGGATLGLHFLDPIIAIFEAVHIVWLAGALFGQSLRGLMDAALPPAAEARIARACRKVPGVTDVVGLRTRQVGAYAWVDAEVQVADGTGVDRASEICRDVQRAIRAALPQLVRSQVKFRAGGAASAPLPQGAG